MPDTCYSEICVNWDDQLHPRRLKSCLRLQYRIQIDEAGMTGEVTKGLSDVELQEIRKRSDAATPGPWKSLSKVAIIQVVQLHCDWAHQCATKCY